MIIPCVHNCSAFSPSLSHRFFFHILSEREENTTQPLFSFCAMLKLKSISSEYIRVSNQPASGGNFCLAESWRRREKKKEVDRIGDFLMLILLFPRRQTMQFQ